MLDEDKLTIDSGDKEVMEKVMKAEKIERQPIFFKTPPGWPPAPARWIR
jgi:hypothetical protein